MSAPPEQVRTQAATPATAPRDGLAAVVGLCSAAAWPVQFVAGVSGFAVAVALGAVALSRRGRAGASGECSRSR